LFAPQGACARGYAVGLEERGGFLGPERNRRAAPRAGNSSAAVDPHVTDTELPKAVPPDGRSAGRARTAHARARLCRDREPLLARDGRSALRGGERAGQAEATPWPGVWHSPHETILLGPRHGPPVLNGRYATARGSHATLGPATSRPRRR